jgi:hypothetical protein
VYPRSNTEQYGNLLDADTVRSDLLPGYICRGLSIAAEPLLASIRSNTDGTDLLLKAAIRLIAARAWPQHRVLRGKMRRHVVVEGVTSVASVKLPTAISHRTIFRCLRNAGAPARFTALWHISCVIFGRLDDQAYAQWYKLMLARYRT